MASYKKAVFFLCGDLGIDPVAGHVFNKLKIIYDLKRTDIIIDDKPVLKHTDKAGNEFYFAETHKVICHDYTYYLPIMNQYFSDSDMSGLITWHEGQNAPDKILSVHTTGDVDSGNFGNANPQYMHNLLWGLEKHKIDANIDDFMVTTEATHWSGMVYGEGNPKLIPIFPVPIIDIEIGSTAKCWDNSAAAEVIARSLTEIFNEDNKTLMNLLCVGAVHFEPSFANAVFETWDDKAFGISHIIPNHWLVTGQYENEDGLIKLENCIDSIIGGISGIAFHDKLKGTYKSQLRILGERYNIPVFKHQLLRRPEDIPFKYAGKTV